MFRRIWFASTMLAAGLLPAAGILPGTPAAAQDLGAEQAELVDRLYSESLTRAEMVGLYETLVQGEFEPPACETGEPRMFTDVPASHLFCAWIEELARRGITGGCGDGSTYCPGDPVTRAQMATFIVRATADEPPHLVGEPGEPEFGNGGEDDCRWGNPPPDSGIAFFANPVSFYKDSDGVVHLAGLPAAFNGSGGDGVCGVPSGPLGDDGDILDRVIFQLPEGYRPEHLEVFVSANTLIALNFIVPVGGLTVEGTFLEGGTVLVANIPDAEFGQATTLDGYTFRAATPDTAVGAVRRPASVSLQALRDLLD